MGGNPGNYYIVSEDGIETYNDKYGSPISYVVYGKDYAPNYIRANARTNVRGYYSPEDLDSFLLIDTTKKILYFKEFYSLQLTSVRRRFLEVLAERWKYWEIRYIEGSISSFLSEYLDFDPYPKQIRNFTTESNSNFTLRFWDNATTKQTGGYTHFIALKKENQFHFWCHLDNHIPDDILEYGPKVLDDIIKYKSSDVLLESFFSGEGYFKGMAINADSSEIFIESDYVDNSLNGVWDSWKILDIQYGYIGLLEKIGFPTKDMILSEEEINELMPKLPTIDDNLKLEITYPIRKFFTTYTRSLKSISNNEKAYLEFSEGVLVDRPELASLSDNKPNKMS